VTEETEMVRKERPALEDQRVHVKVKLASLWTSLMFCYIYGDYFGLYKPGKLQGMLEGQMGFLGRITQGVLLGTSVLMAIPALMVFLSLILTPDVNRWLNVILGLVYTVIMLITIPGAWAFYVFLGIVEVVLSLLIVWTAWKWPRQRRL
jgi:uncharacterized protein DUF6326